MSTLTMASRFSMTWASKFSMAWSRRSSRFWGAGGGVNGWSSRRASRAKRYGCVTFSMGVCPVVGGGAGVLMVGLEASGWCVEAEGLVAFGS
jgi:hypothetical protein